MTLLGKAAVASGDGTFTIDPLIPGDSKLGRPPRYPKRAIVNAIFYLVRSSCAWRMIPHDLPPWRICYHYFSKWKHEGVWEAIHERLRDIVRAHHGKKSSKRCDRGLAKC